MEKQFDKKQVLKVLFLEDSQKDFEIISELMNDGESDFSLERVENQLDFISSLQTQKYDVILSDFTLPDFNAFGALKFALEICPSIPFIVVSGTIGEEKAIELIKKGASDYVLKDRMERLPYSVKMALEAFKEKEALKQAEEALKKSEEEFRGLFENAPVGIYRTTPQGQILKANPFMVKMLGYNSLDELLKRDLSVEGFEENYKRDEFKTKIEQNGSVRGLETQWLLKDGSLIYVSENANLISDENNKPLYYDGIVEDISGRKKAEQEVQERIDYLEHFHQITVGREMKMIELKKEINLLLKELGKDEKYFIV